MGLLLSNHCILFLDSFHPEPQHFQLWCVFRYLLYCLKLKNKCTVNFVLES